MDWKALVANGKLTARDFSYKNIAVISAESEFIFSKGQLNLPTLAVTRTEGSGKGQVLYDFGERWVELKGVNAKIHVQEIAPMFGPRFTEYMQPYRFVQPPKVIANGKIDLNETRSPQLTDLAVQVESDGLLGYTFLGVPLQFKKPSVDLTIKNRQLHLKSKSAELFDGKVGLTLDLNMDKPVPEFSTSINLADCNFQSFMKSFFGYEQSTGNLTARGNFQGALGRMDTMKGEGNVTVVEGFVLNIPFLGGLSELLGSIIPNFGVAKAGKAFANYTLADGIVTTQDLEIASANFTMLGRGGYSYIKDDLNMDARVNVRGVVGLLLFPVSKLFEYHGSGSLKNPKWSPKIFEG